MPFLDHCRFNKVPEFKGVNATGFTLIEVMIAVTIIAILAAIAMPNYTAWVANTKVRTATESINAGLQKARVEAIRRNVRVQFQLTTAGTSAWRVSCVVATECADLTAGVVEERGNGDGSTAQITVAATPASATTIVFNNLGQVLNTTTTPAAATAPFTQLEFTNSTLSTSDKRDLRVTIGAGGISRTCDPYSGLSTSDPRRC